MTTEPPTATCTYCNGKGYNSRCYDEIGSDDFGGEGYTKRGLIEKVPCKKCQKEAPQEMCHCGRVIKGTGEFRHCPVGHYPEAPEAPKAPREEATENMKAKMNFIQKEWNDPFADDEIIGDHQTIVELYRYARELEAKLEVCEKENAKMQEISKQDLLILKDLRDICIDDDLLDLDSYDSFARADKISNAWKALRVIDKLLSLLTP